MPKTIITADSVRISSGSYKWDDSQVPATTQRTGVVAPTLATGFRGNAGFQMLTMVNNQADEVQFTVQLNHEIALNSLIRPHIHYSPTVNVADGSYAVKFILEYYWADINAQFPAGPATYEMTDTFTVASNNHIWKHLIASNVTDITMDKAVSSILVCRLYRDNTISNNYPQPVAMLSFDIHYQKDSYGSETERTK